MASSMEQMKARLRKADYQLRAELLKECNLLIDTWCQERREPTRDELRSYDQMLRYADKIGGPESRGRFLGDTEYACLDAPRQSLTQTRSQRLTGGHVEYRG